MSAKRELRSDAMARRIYERVVRGEFEGQRLTRMQPWNELSEAERARITAAVEDLLEDHSILPGWILL